MAEYIIDNLKALSIRQPWAWLIVNGHKPIENRSWKTKFRGHILVHASKGMTRMDYKIAHDTAALFGIKIPAMVDLERGGIVGITEIVDCVETYSSSWFFGKYGFVLEHSSPLPFAPCKGMLGFFKPQL